MFNRLTAGAGALSSARKLTGKPYVYGGTWPQSGGTDCDGLVVFAYGEVGIKLIRPTETTYREYPFDDRSQPNEPGDLLFIPGDPIDANPGHVVMYVSPGQCFEAEETGTLIGQRAFDTNSWEFRTRPALAYPAPAPVVQKLIAGMTWTPNVPAGKGDWLVHNGHKTGIPSPAELATIKAHGIAEHVLNDYQIKALITVAWGDLE